MKPKPATVQRNRVRCVVDKEVLYHDGARPTTELATGGGQQQPVPPYPGAGDAQVASGLVRGEEVESPTEVRREFDGLRSSGARGKQDEIIKE